MSIIGFPLLLIPVAICNIIVFLMPGVGFDAPITKVALPSGAVWAIDLGQALVALGALLLMLEVIKAGRPGAKYITDHILSLLVLAGTVAEFVLLPQFGNATMALLAILALVDFLAGISLRNSRKRALRAAVAPAGSRRPTPKAAPAPVAPPAAEPASATLEPMSASAAAASIAEAVLLDRPEPVTASAAVASQPSVASPGLQPEQDAAAPRNPPSA